jgi:hypothetical protein
LVWTWEGIVKGEQINNRFLRPETSKSSCAVPCPVESKNGKTEKNEGKSADEIGELAVLELVWSIFRGEMILKFACHQ